MSLIKEMIAGALGRPDSVSGGDILNMAKRNPYSRYLPWLTYHPQKQVHLLTDNNIAYLYELTPLNYAGQEQIKNIASALKQPFPDGTIIQFILAPDSDIEYILDYYKKRKTRDNKIGQIMTEETAKFIGEGAKRLEKNAHIPVRVFRCFACVKSADNIEEIIPTFEQMMKSANVNPVRMSDSHLIEWARSVFNNKPQRNQKPVTDFNETEVFTRDKPIREYCIDRETVIDFRSRPAKIADRYAACLTPTVIPKSMNPQQTNAMFGGIMGLQDDQIQLNFPFLYSLNIIYDSDRTTLDNKAAVTMSQNFAGKFVTKIKSRLKEFGEYESEKETNRFVKVLPTLWVFGDSKEELSDAVGRTKTVWAKEDAGAWQVEREGLLEQTLFIASSLGGLYNVYSNVNTIDRHLYMTLDAAANLVPIQGDFSGNGLPNTVLVGRKGQLIGLDVFAKGSTNHNYLVCAESGGGKSFWLGTLLMDAYMAGEKLRVVDLGRSYEKMCRIAGGKFIDFNRRHGKQVINPLDFYAKDEEDLEANIVAASTVIAAMIYSKSQQQIPEHEWVIVVDAVKWAIAKQRSMDGTDAIYDYLRNYKEHCGDEPTYIPEFEAEAKRMAHNLKAFTSNGSYGSFFVGKSTINIADDDFVVIELDDIKGDPELFNVVVLQMMNEVTQDLYLSNRQQRRFILFEEAPTILKENGVNNLSYLGQMTEEGYRRARKYGGSFGVVMQSINDTQLMGQLGQVVLSNAAYKFMLTSKSGQYAKACKDGVLDYDGFSESILTSLVNNKPYYAELFIESPQSRGVARLVVDSFRYHINSTESEDVALFMALTDSRVGKLSAEEALMLVWKRRLNSSFFQNLTKSGVDQVVALRETLYKANVTPDEYPHIFNEARNENEAVITA